MKDLEIWEQGKLLRNLLEILGYIEEDLNNYFLNNALEKVKSLKLAVRTDLKAIGKIYKEKRYER